MKANIFFVIILALFLCGSCDFDSYPYYYDSGQSKPNDFKISGMVYDADSLWGVENIKVMMKPESTKDTFVKYTDSTGIFEFRFLKNYGSYATFMLRDTAGVYADFDTLLNFSGRDFNRGVREFFVYL